MNNFKVGDIVKLKNELDSEPMPPFYRWDCLKILSFNPDRGTMTLLGPNNIADDGYFPTAFELDTKFYIEKIIKEILDE